MFRADAYNGIINVRLGKFSKFIEKYSGKSRSLNIFQMKKLSLLLLLGLLASCSISFENTLEITGRKTTKLSAEILPFTKVNKVEQTTTPNISEHKSINIFAVSRTPSETKTVKEEKNGSKTVETTGPAV